MGAPFNNVVGILMLTGCNHLTISPKLLDELAKSYNPTTKHLDTDTAVSMDDIKKINMDEDTFQWMMNQDTLAIRRLVEGISGFGTHIESLEEKPRSKI